MAKLYFYFSAMNAGKTTTLLQSAHNYRERGMRVAILTPRLDDRAGQGVVASRIGLQAEGIAFTGSADPLVVRAKSTRSPSGVRIFASSVMSSSMPRRNSGSPPVRRSFRTPSLTAALAMRSISVKLSSWS